MNKFLNDDNLVFVGDNWKEVKKKYFKWKEKLERKQLKVNVNQTTAMKTGTKSPREEADDAVDANIGCIKDSQISKES